MRLWEPQCLCKVIQPQEPDGSPCQVLCVQTREFSTDSPQKKKILISIYPYVCVLFVTLGAYSAPSGIFTIAYCL